MADEQRLPRLRLAHPDVGFASVSSQPEEASGGRLIAAQFALAQGRASEAAAALESSLGELTLASAATLAVLGQAYEQLGELERSSRASRQALELLDQSHGDPEPAEAVALAPLLTAVGRGDDALRLLRSASLRPLSDPSVGRALADWLKTVGDQRAASRVLSTMARVESSAASIDLLREAVRLDPDDPDLETNLGAALLLFGDPQAALDSLRRISENAPPGHIVNGWLAEAQRRTGDVTGALERAQAILGEDRANTLGLHVSASCNAALGRFDAAIEHASRLVTLDPDDMDARRLHVEILAEAGQLDEAVAASRSLVDSRPDHPTAHALLGSMLERSGDELAAITAFDSALALDPADANARFARIELYRRTGRLGEARRELDRMLEEDSGNATLLATRGQVLIAEGQLEDGVALIDQALAVSPGLLWALVEKAAAELRMERVQDALESLELLMRQRPGDAEAHLFKGEVLLQLARADDALEDADAVLAREPQHVLAHYLRARALIALDLPRDAIVALDRVIETVAAPAVSRTQARGVSTSVTEAPATRTGQQGAEFGVDLADAYLLRANTYATVAEWDDAARDFEAALALRPDADALLGLGRSRYALGQLESAREDCEAAVRAAQSESQVTRQAEALSLLGEIQRLQGDHDSSLRTLDQALELEPDGAFALGTKGQVLTAVGRDDEAKQALAAALEIDGSLGWARESLAELLRMEGEFEPALRELDIAVAAGQESGWLRGTRGQVLSAMGRYAEALEELQRAWQLEKASWIAEALAGELARSGSSAELEEAAGILDEALVVTADARSLLASKAEVLRVANRPNEALPIVEQFLSENPDDQRALGTRAQLLVDVRSYADGLEAARALVARDPHDTFARSACVLALMGLNRHNEALSEADRALELNPSDGTAEMLRLAALVSLGRFESVIQHGEALLTRDPDNSFASLTVGMAMRRLHPERAEEAIAEIRRAVESEPENTQWTAELCDSLSGMGRLEEARPLREALVASAVDSARTDPDVITPAGWSALWLGQADRSVELLREAIRLEPTRISSRFLLGIALLAAGRDALAIDELEGAVVRTVAFDDKERAQAVLREAARDLSVAPVAASRERPNGIIDRARAVIMGGLHEPEQGDSSGDSSQADYR